LKRFIFRSNSWSANSQRLLGYLLELQFWGASYWKHSIGAEFAAGSTGSRVEPLKMSKPSQGILPVLVFLMFPGRGSRRGLAGAGLANWGWPLLRMFAVYCAQCLKSRETDGVRPPWRRAWTAIICLCFVALAPVTLRSQTPSKAPASHSAEAKRLYQAGVALAERGQLDKAIATFRQALESDRENPVLLDATGAAFSVKGDFEQAKQYFLESLQSDPAFIPARKNLAITYFNMGQYSLAATEFESLKNSSPASSPIANLFLGMIAEKNADYVQAVSLLEQSGTLLDRYPEALLSLANSETELKHFRLAQIALSNVESLMGLTASQYLNAAELRARLGQYRQALADLDKAHAKDGQLERLAYQRAVVLDQMNRPQEALAVLTDLAATNPDSDALNLLAHVAQKSGDFGLAMQSLRQAAKLDPTREDNYLDFSTICADLGNYPLALEAANVGLEHLPNSYRLLVEKGVVLENLGRLEEAEDTLRGAGQLQKDNSVALLSLAIVETHAGQLEDARATLSSAIESFPDNYYMHYHLGKILVQLEEANPAVAGLGAGAKHAFEQAIRFKPSYADSYYQLSKLYLKESPKLAEQNLLTCLRLDPNHAPAEYTLARLYLSTGRREAGQKLIDRFESQQQAAKLKEQQKPRIESAQK
jgi:tetratricopeptide (TPR) repeat protein